MGFPNFKNKHAEKSMISPKELISYQIKGGRYPKFKPPIGIIFCYEKNLIKYILDNHKITKIKNPYGDMFFLNETNKKIAVIGNFGIGAPAVVAILEEFIALDTKRFISIGTAGSLQKNIKVGDVIVCDKAIRDEGTSYHYLKDSKYAYAGKEITQKIIKSLKKFNQKYLVGTSWTIDAPYRETFAEVKQYQEEGVAMVEMEASALFAVAKYRNVELGVISTISDYLAESDWKPEFYSKKTKKGLEILYKVALDVLSNNY